MAGEWRVSPLIDVAEIVMGQSPPGSTYNETGQGLPFFQGVKDFNYRHPTPRVFCSAPSRIAKPGEILFSVRAPIGRVNIADRECAIGRGLAIVRPRDEADSRYIEFSLRHLEPTWQAIEGGGSVFGNATRQDLEQLPLVWPEDVSERRAIAHVLGALDDKIDLNGRTNETLGAIARALFRSWFVDFDPVCAKAEDRDPGLPKPVADLFPDSFEDSELGEIPKGWEVTTIGELANVVGGTTPSTKEAAFWNDGRHYWATPKDLSILATSVLLETERKITDAGLAQIGSGLLPPGTVLLSSRAPIGYLAVSEVPVAINQGFIAMLPAKGVSNLFLLYWAGWAQEEIVSRANGSTFLEISKANFRPIPVVTPPAGVFDAFDKLVGPLYARIVSDERESRALVALRDNLLPKLIAGDLRIEDAKRLIGESRGVTGS